MKKIFVLVAVASLFMLSSCSKDSKGTGENINGICECTVKVMGKTISKENIEHEGKCSELDEDVVVGKMTCKPN